MPYNLYRHIWLNILKKDLFSRFKKRISSDFNDSYKKNRQTFQLWIHDNG